MNYLSHALSAAPYGNIGIVGSALPDIRHNGFNQLHRPSKSRLFLSFVSDSGCDIRLAYGALNHQILDAISNQRGTYFAQAKSEIAPILEENGLPSAYADLVLEIGIDYLLMKECKSAAAMARAAWEEADIGRISEAMAGFFSQDIDEVRTTLLHYQMAIPKILEMYETIEGCADAAAMRINRLRQGRKRERKKMDRKDFLESFGKVCGRLYVPYYSQLWSAISSAKKAEDLLTNREF